jgi:hypothetical protein
MKRARSQLTGPCLSRSDSEIKTPFESYDNSEKYLMVRTICEV